MKTFKSKKHKKKVNRLILFTSDAADSKVRQIRLSPGSFRFLVLLVCIVAGVAAGYLVYGGSLYQHFLSIQGEQRAIIAELEEQNEIVTAENMELSEKVTILSETVNQKVQAEKEADEQNKAMSLPTEFPLTGSAKVEETTTDQMTLNEEEVVGYIRTGDTQEEEEEPEESYPICIFTATEGTTAVAAGNGTVISVTSDLQFGNKIVIDHGNGYQTVYLNQGAAKVKEGDTILRGVTLYVISEENTLLGYQMLKDEEYMNPMEMIAISG